MYKYWPWLRRIVSGDEKLIFITQYAARSSNRNSIEGARVLKVG